MSISDDVRRSCTPRVHPEPVLVRVNNLLSRVSLVLQQVITSFKVPSRKKTIARAILMNINRTHSLQSIETFARMKSESTRSETLAPALSSGSIFTVASGENIATFHSL